MLADLHIHTCFSDGTMTPEEAAARGAELGFGILAAADHNSWQGWERFSAACRELGIRPVRGMEVDCLYDGRDIHLLAYGFSPVPPLVTLAAESRRLLLKMSDDLIEKLIPLYPELHLSVAECQAWPFDPAAGGRAVLAHPCNWFDAERPQELLSHLDALRRMGLDGIECHYPANSPEMTALCRRYCRDHGLLITAGSDDHGAFGKNHHGIRYYMGAVRVDERDLVLGELLEDGPHNGKDV